MRIARTSSITGITHIRDIPDLTQEMLDAWESGMLIQDAMPTLSAGDREFLMTGITPEEWDEAFGQDD